MYDNDSWLSKSGFETYHLKRQQLWRQVSQIFIHENEDHLWETIINQILIGSCLEIVNGWKTVYLVYFGGAFVSDMVDFFGGTGIQGCGATGYIMAMYGAYLATIILNWKETSSASIRTSNLLFCIFGNLTAPFWYPHFVTAFEDSLDSLYKAAIEKDFSHASTIGGGLGGFVFGMSLVNNYRKRLWKIKVKKNFCFVAIVFYRIVNIFLFCNPLFHSSALQNNYLGKLLALRDLLTDELAKSLKS